MQYKNGQLVSKQVSPAPFAAMALLPDPGRWAASSPQLLPLLGGLHGKSGIFTCPSLSAGHSGPLGGGAAAGSDQLLSQLHGTAEAAQEKVTAQVYVSGNITLISGELSSRSLLKRADLQSLSCCRFYIQRLCRITVSLSWSPWANNGGVSLF